MLSRIFTIAILSMLLSLAGAAQTSDLSAPANGLVKCASVPINGAVPGALAASSLQIYVGTESGTLHALHGPGLETRWRMELGGEFASEIVAADDGALAVTNVSGSSRSADKVSRLHFLSSQSGVTVWLARLPFSEKYYLGRTNGFVAAVSQEGAVFFLNPADGQIVRRTDPKGRLSTQPVFSYSGVLFGGGNRQVFLVAAKGAEFAFKHDSEHVPSSVGFLRNGGFAVGDERGYLAKYGPQDGNAIWKFKGGAAISSVTETAEGIIVTSLDNFVYMLSDYNGDVIWKRRLTGRVLDGGLLLQEALVAVVYGENTAYVIDRQNGKVLDQAGFAETDLVSRTPVRIAENAFALSSGTGLQTYSIGPCPGK